MTGAGAIPPGWRLRVEDSLPSTSDLLLRLAAAGEPAGLSVLARRQTAGRGRDGRAWDSPAGNLSVSVLLRPDAPARQAPLFGLLAAVALAEALSTFLPDPAAIRLKWPNDLLLGGAKLAGMLCESSADAAGRIEWLVIGLGANLAHAPALPERPTACLGALVPAPAPEAVAARLLQGFDGWLRLVAAEGFAPVLGAWASRGPQDGDPLSVRRGASRLDGRFAGLAPDGSLRLDVGGAIRSIASGEVSATGS